MSSCKHASTLAEPTGSGQNARPFLEPSIVSASAEEFRTLVRLALPLMAAQLLQMAQGVMDTIMAGHLSAPDLAGIALGLNVLWPSQFLVSGFVLAATPIIAQLRGAGRVGEVVSVPRQIVAVFVQAHLVRPRCADESGRGLDVIHAAGPGRIVAFVVLHTERLEAERRVNQLLRHVEIVGHEGVYIGLRHRVFSVE